MPQHHTRWLIYTSITKPEELIHYLFAITLIKYLTILGILPFQQCFNWYFDLACDSIKFLDFVFLFKIMGLFDTSSILEIILHRV